MQFRVALKAVKVKKSPERSFFSIKRPDLASNEDERQHRQNLTDFILFLRDADAGDHIKMMLHKET